MSDFESKLKVFDAKPSTDFPEFLLVVCGHDDCPSKAGKTTRPFLVHKRTWLRPVKLVTRNTGKAYTVIGRQCPYCSRTGRLPARERPVSARRTARAAS